VQLARVERTAIPLARELFARWLERVVGVPAATGAQRTASAQPTRA
jgi:hypothetical protein